MVGFLVLSALSVYTVSFYLGGLDKEMAKNVGLPGRIPKRKVSSVSVLSDDGEESIYGEEELERREAMRVKEWQQFQAYFHRPSWHSSTVAILTGDEGEMGGRRASGNTLPVPEIRF